MKARPGTLVKKPGRAERGGSAIEFAFLAPWIFFVFVGTFALGFFTKALTLTENAARAAGLYYVSSQQQASDVTKACYYALEILRKEPNVGSRINTCAASAAAVSQSAPVALTTLSVNAGPDGQPATIVSITYQTIPMIPIPGLPSGQFTVTRAAEFKR